MATFKCSPTAESSFHLWNDVVVVVVVVSFTEGNENKTNIYRNNKKQVWGGVWFV